MNSYLQNELQKAGPCPHPTIFLPGSARLSLNYFGADLFGYGLYFGNGDDGSVSTSYGGTTLDGAPVDDPN
jgi:hypothetical protein